MPSATSSASRIADRPQPSRPCCTAQAIASAPIATAASSTNSSCGNPSIQPGTDGSGIVVPWPPSMVRLMLATAARMNGTASVSSAKISPRRLRSRNATAPIASASSPDSAAPASTDQTRLTPCRPVSTATAYAPVPT